MRHLKRNAKLGRKGEHRNAMLANLVCSLIKAWKGGKCVTTTLAKAKAARPVAEKLVTLGKKGSIHHRRLAAARLKQQARTHFKGRLQGKNPVPGKELREAWRENEDVVRILFDEIAPEFKERPGGYTRIVKLHRRRGDAAEMAMLEWVDEAFAAPVPAAPKAKKEKKIEEPEAEEAKAEDAEETVETEPAEASAQTDEEVAVEEAAPEATDEADSSDEAAGDSDAEVEKPSEDSK
jgi:large subunit ribosomal protein L17